VDDLTKFFRPKERDRQDVERGRRAVGEPA
jgi:hypothetical protein